MNLIFKTYFEIVNNGRLYCAVLYDSSKGFTGVHHCYINNNFKCARLAKKINKFRRYVRRYVRIGIKKGI